MNYLRDAARKCLKPRPFGLFTAIFPNLAPLLRTETDGIGISVDFASDLHYSHGPQVFDAKRVVMVKHKPFHAEDERSPPKHLSNFI